MCLSEALHEGECLGRSAFAVGQVAEVPKKLDGLIVFLGQAGLDECVHLLPRLCLMRGQFVKTGLAGRLSLFSMTGFLLRLPCRL